MDELSTTLLNQTEGRQGGQLMEFYRHGRTKKAVADELGVHPSLITLIEQGNRNISKKLLRKMAEHPEYLGVN